MDTERWEQKHQERMERHRLRMERRQARWDARSSCGGPNANMGGMIIGLCVVAVGVLFLLRNVGILYFDDIWQYWPAVLIVIGISKLANTHSASQVTSGLILGGIGTVFLLRNLGYIYGNIWQYLWPGILIAVGLSILVKHLEGRGQDWSPGPPAAGTPPPGAPPGPANPFPTASAFTASSSRSNYLHIENVFSGTRQKLDTQDFLGGKVTTVFGGAEIDLRAVGTKLDEVSIKAEAIFGGIELWVPAHWQTIVRGSAVFGGFEDKTFPAAPGASGKAPRLVVTGAAVFGGVVVKN
ncbi:MAG: cell wall-active antibiotics response protein [Acidobacteriia bacterium]|nr:cell wall-active antibiotics response protein [Terriglobia bacterium]